MPGGRFGYIMPWALLRGRQYAGFRPGRYELRDHVSVAINFCDAWDLHAVKPSFFPVPACVVLGNRSSDHQVTPLPETVVSWEGRLPRPNLDWNEAAPHLRQHTGSVGRAVAFVSTTGSQYQTDLAKARRLCQECFFWWKRRRRDRLGLGQVG